MVHLERTIISTKYIMGIPHHLMDEEKQKAIGIYSKLLHLGGKIVFANTMYLSKEEHNRAIQEAKENLAVDLATECYPTVPFVNSIFEENGSTVSFNRCNPFVWIVETEKL